MAHMLPVILYKNRTHIAQKDLCRLRTNALELLQA
jgi:hypothetical protein